MCLQDASPVEFSLFHKLTVKNSKRQRYNKFITLWVLGKNIPYRLLLGNFKKKKSGEGSVTEQMKVNNFRDLCKRWSATVQYRFVHQKLAYHTWSFCNLLRVVQVVLQTRYIVTTIYFAIKDFRLSSLRARSLGDLWGGGGNVLVISILHFPAPGVPERTCSKATASLTISTA